MAPCFLSKMQTHKRAWTGGTGCVSRSAPIGWRLPCQRCLPMLGQLICGVKPIKMPSTRARIGLPPVDRLDHYGKMMTTLVKASQVDTK